LDQRTLLDTLAKHLPKALCDDLLREFLLIRQDVATGTLGRGAPGKFIETVVQCLQHLDQGKYESKPNVEKFLTTLESSPSKIRDDLRICASRIARSMYSLRNKRNIVHKGEVDPNSYDLRFLLAGAQWIMAELFRVAATVSMEEAGRIIEAINAPVGTFVEDIAGRRIVHANVTAQDEILLLLQSNHPALMSLKRISHSLNRRNARAVANATRTLYSLKLIEGDTKSGYVLTRTGLERAVSIATELVR
jgi:hypothetical protein